MREPLGNLHPSLRGWTHRKVFLTGATGLIGGQILYELLRLPQVDEIVCLARPVNGHTGMERLAKRLKKCGVKGPELEEGLSRVRYAEGSLTQPGWGLSAADLEWIRNEADLFINCAASTSFVDTQSCEAINIGGTRNMLDVVAGAKKLRRLVHFSTATVCGCLPDRIIHEDESLPVSANHVFAYTRTKAESERILWAQADRLPLLVVRPSITMAWPGRDPKQAKLFLWGMIAMAHLPYVPVRRESYMDVVTLEFVVQSTMRLIAKGDRLSHPVYHLSAGVAYANNCGEVQDVAFAASRLEKLPEIVPPEEWDESHEQAIADAGMSTLYEALQVLLPYINLNLRYDNTRLIEELGGDLPHLPKFTEYFPEMVATIDPDLVTIAGLHGETFGM